MSPMNQIALEIALVGIVGLVVFLVGQTPDLLTLLPPVRQWRRRRIAAVLAAIEGLATSLESRKATPNEEARKAIGAEISAILSLLARRDAVVAELWGGAPREEDTFPQIALRLQTLARALKARRAVLKREQ